MENVFGDICFSNTENTLCLSTTEVVLSCMTAGDGEIMSSVTQPEKAQRNVDCLAVFTWEL